MPLVPQQAILHGQGATFALALAELETQMDEMPEVRIVSISVTNPIINFYRLVAVVETV